MENKLGFRPDPKLKLMEQVREVLRYHHYAYRTERWPPCTYGQLPPALPRKYTAVRETMGNPSFPRKKDQSIPGQTKNVVIMP